MNGFAATATLTLLLSLTACASSSAPGAQDPSRQSEAEYDIARDLWLRRGQTRQALERALKATELDPQNADAAHLVALLYLDFCSRGPADCKLDQAERFARQAVELKPDYREAKNTLGVALIHRKKAPEAVQVLRPLTEDILYQTPENAWGNLGWAYLELGRFDDAIDALRRSVAAQPLFCVGNYRLGLAYERKGAAQQAREAFTRALETEAPGCTQLQDAWAARARTLIRAGEADSARVDLERCIALAKSSIAGKECSSMLAKLK